MRQAWINDLRKRIADIMSTSHHYYVAAQGDDSEEGEKEAAEVHKAMLFLYREIELMLNPNEKEHQDLLQHLQKITFGIGQKETIVQYPTIMGETTALAQKIFKAEWDRVKKGS
jgi:hypothetical protein